MPHIHIHLHDTSEGAKKAWAKRRAGGGTTPSETKPRGARFDPSTGWVPTKRSGVRAGGNRFDPSTGWEPSGKGTSGPINVHAPHQSKRFGGVPPEHVKPPTELSQMSKSDYAINRGAAAFYAGKPATHNPESHESDRHDFSLGWMQAYQKATKRANNAATTK